MTRAKNILIIVMSLLFVSSLALANGLNLNSIGSRALAMGGAFVGLADDFSALYWNPAGMSQFTTKTLGFYGTDIIPSGTYVLEVPTALGTLTMVDAKTMSKHYLSGMLAYYHPINERIVAGIGVYVPSGLGSAWDGADFVNVSEGTPYEWSSKIGLITFAPGFSYKVSDKIALGIALNINYGMFDIMRHAGAPAILGFDLGQYEESMTGWGFGATFGVLAKPIENLSCGLTIRTASAVNFSGEAMISNLSLLGLPGTSEAERTVTWPMWIAGGVAFRPMDRLVVTADIQYSNWKVVDTIETVYKDSYWQIIMASSGSDKIPMAWDDAVQYRIGLEYALTNVLFLRGGYYYDPSPAPDATMNVLLPSYNFNAFTFGLGYALNGLQIDVGGEFLMGQDRNISFEHLDAQPGKYGMKIIVPTISVTYRF